MKKKELKIMWETKGGHKIKISDMSDGHLTNAINYLKKNVESKRQHLLRDGYKMMSVVKGDLKLIDTISERQNELATMDEVGILKETNYYELVAELDKRKK